MTVPSLVATPLTGSRPGHPPLVVGPSLGTTTTLWEPVATALAGDLEVLGFDLPGHGASLPTTDGFTIAGLAEAVLDLIEDTYGTGTAFHYAGESIGGAIGLALALRAPDQVLSLTPVCTGAKLGQADAWQDRAALVRGQGMGAMVEGSRQRWFGPGFMQRHPQVAEGLLADLTEVDAESYALACLALAEYDLREQIHRIAAPTLVITGAADVVAPPEVSGQIAAAIPGARHVVLENVGHQAPVEATDRVANELRALTGSAGAPTPGET